MDVEQAQGVMATALPDDHPDKAAARRVLLAEAARLEAAMAALDDSDGEEGGDAVAEMAADDGGGGGGCGGEAAPPAAQDVADADDGLLRRFEAARQRVRVLECEVLLVEAFKERVR